VIDERLQELVSRAIDGDLDDVESAEFEARARRDPELAAELESARRLREAVGELAAAMAPPTDLDAVVEPLRHGMQAPRPSVRPAVRWLGVAAALALGVTVAVEIAQRNPVPPASMEREHRVRSIDDEAVFPLAPLPTANPDEPRPFGASERLLAEEPQEPEAPEPEPLEVVGPLPLDSGQPGEADAERTAEAPEPGSAAEVNVRRDMDKGRPSPSSASREGGRDAAAPSELGVGGETATGGKLRLRSSMPAPAARVTAEDAVTTGSSMSLIIGGRRVWSGTADGCPAERRAVRVEVLAGVVVAVAPAGEGAAVGTAAACRPATVVGVRLEGVGDGTHPAEWLVETDPR